MNIETSKQVRFNSYSYRVETTAGTLFVIIMEDLNGEPCGIQLNIGKAGGELSAVAHGLARVCSLALDKGAKVSDLIQELSNNTTDKQVRGPNGEVIRSFMEGVTKALVEYGRDRYGRKLSLIAGSDIHPRLGRG